MNDVLYNAQKRMIEEIKQTFLKKTEFGRQRNVIKETCNEITKKHYFDDVEIMNDRVLQNTQKAIFEEVKNALLKKAMTEHDRTIIKETCNYIARKHHFNDLK